MRRIVGAFIVAVAVVALAFAVSNNSVSVSAQAGANGGGEGVGSGAGGGVSTTAKPKPYAQACINSNGTLDSGTNIVSSGKAAEAPTGGYQVITGKNIRGCFYQATIGTCADSGTAGTGEIEVAARFSSVNGVFVGTRNSAGAASDRSFFLLVTC
jgi:hypothetical protein